MPAFLLIGWGLTLPVLGSGLLLYSFGKWALPGPGVLGHSPPGVSCGLTSTYLVSPASCRGRGALPVLCGCQLW